MSIRQNDKKIVLISSDSSFTEEMKEILCHHEYSVDHTYSDGIDAVIGFEEMDSDAVIIDDHIALLSADAVAGKLRKKGYTGIILEATEQYTDENTRNDVDGILVKPITEKFLIPWLYAKLLKEKEIRNISDKNEKLTNDIQIEKNWQEAVGMVASSEKICIQEAEALLNRKISQSKYSKEEFLENMFSH